VPFTNYQKEKRETASSDKRERGDDEDVGRKRLIPRLDKGEGRKGEKKREISPGFRGEKEIDLESPRLLYFPRGGRGGGREESEPSSLYSRGLQKRTRSFEKEEKSITVICRCLPKEPISENR